MHLIEAYSLTCGCKISNCHIKEDHIDIPQRYITFHCSTEKGNSKLYDHWNEVLYKLKSDPNFDYDIVQVGDIGFPAKHIDISLLGKTTYNSLAYVIKNTRLHLGIDSFPIHLASYYNKKIVALYSYYSSTCGPYFSDKEDIRIFEPDFSKYKPTFGYNDPNRLINTINPDKVYKAVMELL